MARGAPRSTWARLLGISAGIVLLVAVLCGCETARFYRQAIQGQYEILTQRQPIAELIEAPATDPELKRKFELVLRLRQFAETNLQLPADKHYLAYVDLGRRFVVWNVHAAPQFSLEPRTWWYPFVGSLKYRGYFNEADARRYAEKLQEEGEDVYVEGVQAYSTLGWFSDPLLNTFIYHPEPVLAEIIFHELVHQRLFVSGDTDFNEAFATAASEEGVRRWLLAAGNQSGYQDYLTALQRNGQFVKLVMNARARLESLYQEMEGTGSGNSGTSRDATVLGEKERIIAGLKSDYEKLKASWGGYSGYDAWFARPINNAQLNTIAVYYELVPAFEALLERESGDLGAFYRSVEKLGKMRKELRHIRLREWGAKPAAPEPQKAPP